MTSSSLNPADKGSGAVVMDKDEYSPLLRKASVDDKSKFREASAERPKTKGRPPKYYHSLLLKEKALSLAVHKILPIADAVCIKGSHLAHLYGLPKTHKKNNSQSILSATSTYNYALAKWLEDKLKPLSYNKYMCKMGVTGLTTPTVRGICRVAVF